MSCIVLEGRRRLEGTVEVQTAKNGVLPVLAATILNNGVTVIENCPRLTDVEVTVAILRELGCTVAWNKKNLTVDASNIKSNRISCELMHKMRSSVIFLGSLLSRTGSATICHPGGCELGARPIDIHIAALEQMGAKFSSLDEVIACSAGGRTGCELVLPKPSVGATENIMLFAAGCRGSTRIVNAAREPEIWDLQEYLKVLGYSVKGAGSPVIEVEGKPRTVSAAVTYRPVPDRIAAATWLCAAAITGGTVELKNARPDHMGAVLAVLKESGATVYAQNETLVCTATKRPSAIKRIKTGPYPGFPTDAQPLFFALAAVSQGRTLIEETMFENRFRHGAELRKLGAEVFIRDRFAAVDGVETLHGGEVYARDLRGGAALVLAGLAAEGKTTIRDAHYIDRGYESIETELTDLGAAVYRE